MIMSIRSPSLNAGHLCRRRSDERASARTNSSLAQQIAARSSLFWPRSAQRKRASMLCLAQSITSRRAHAHTRHVRRSNPHS
jgi:hypothetical protein